jgi:hypothetical protein
MADIEKLTRLSDLNLNVLINLSKGIVDVSSDVRYDADFDALLILFGNYHDPYIVHPVDEFVSLLYEPATLRVIGLQVEAFERYFVGKYNELEKVWKLSENSDDFPHKDLGDFYVTAQKRQPVIVQEVSKIANELIFA